MERDPTIRDLYPDLTEEELRAAELNLDRYVAVALRIFERLESVRYPQGSQLTPPDGTLPCTRQR